jgi:ABC-2 type transport system ATP-binding protein
MTTDVMIQATNLSKRFGKTRALDKVSFEVNKGEVVGFLGPNGAGKSTTMRILTCFLAPTTGTAKVNGVDVFDDPLAVRNSLGYLPQRAPLYTDMIVSDYLRFVADVRGIDESKFKQSMDNIIDVCGLAQVLNKDIGTLSHGYRQRVGLGQALLHNPQILILDEPTADLDPNEKAEVIRYIQEIGKDRTVLLSTHNLQEAEEACARAIIVSKGRVVADGNLDDIRARTGAVRYIVVADGPKVPDLLEACEKLSGVKDVREIKSDEKGHRVELKGAKDGDLRADIFKLMVEKGWTLLELRRDAQSLDSVFRDLTRGDEALDRGREWDDAQADAESEGADDEGTDDEGSDDEESTNESSDESSDDEVKKKGEG